MVLSSRLLFASLLAAANGLVTPRDFNLECCQTVTSLLDPHVSLSFKQIHICETTPGVNSYSGYVNLPPNPAEGRPYDIHSFFLFFEARKDPGNAPLAMWLQGGPGVPSVIAAMGENGPCYVMRNGRDTALNPWSWNNEVNMLYLDQPVQTGFSYDTLVNGTTDLTKFPTVVTLLSPGSPPPQLNTTFMAGVFPSQNPKNTANMTQTAAVAAWHFMQTWMQEFPQYKPKGNKFSIWAESWGGHNGPTFANFFTEQNKKIAAGTLPNAVPVHVETVGIINGCVDILTQVTSYPRMAFNNTYGIQVITQAEYDAAMAAFPECKRRVEACRAFSRDKDPGETGSFDEVNTACMDSYYYCIGSMWAGVQSRGRNVYDITAMMPDSFPPRYLGGYLNEKAVQLELGVPLNATGFSATVFNAIMQTGDFVLGTNLPYVGKLLDQGVKVALVYGDKDYQCNWYGGEQVSLAIQSRVSDRFRKAGYAKIQTNASYVGGYVRQYGNLSFSRVFDAGHEAPSYQPETTCRIFNRVMFDRDVATGKLSTAWPFSLIYATVGPDNVDNVTNAVPVQHPAECYLWAIALTCTREQTEMLRNGTAILKDYIMIGYEKADGSIHYY